MPGKITRDVYDRAEDVTILYDSKGNKENLWYSLETLNQRLAPSMNGKIVDLTDITSMDQEQ